MAAMGAALLFCAGSELGTQALSQCVVILEQSFNRPSGLVCTKLQLFIYLTSVYNAIISTLGTEESPRLKRATILAACRLNFCSPPLERPRDSMVRSENWGQTILPRTHACSGNLPRFTLAPRPISWCGMQRLMVGERFSALFRSQDWSLCAAERNPVAFLALGGVNHIKTDFTQAFLFIFCC